MWVRPRLAYQSPGFSAISCLTAGPERVKRSLPMKLKDWLLWLCVVALLVTEVFLLSANRQKEAARVELREAKTELEQLHGQLDQLKNSSVASLSADNARLRAENQGLTQKLSRLQGESRQSQQQVQKLTQQLETAHDTVQQQQQQLQQMQEESQPVSQPASQPANQPASAATEPAAESTASVVAQFNACINNLRQIDAAKQQWALENNRPANAVPTAQDLLPYLPDGLFPICPAGGVYTINAVGVLPTCSVPGHVLTQ